MTSWKTMTSTPSTETCNAAARLLLERRQPLLIAHPRPDGDTLGSMLALRLALLRLGKAPIAACVHPVAPELRFLPGAETVTANVPEDAPIDLVVAVDLSDLKRTGGLYYESWRRYPLLVIDHHGTNDGFGDVNLIEPHAAATAQPMTALIETLGVPLDSDIATCLLTGLLTDTRGLRTTTTTPAVLELTAKLIAAGGDYHDVMRQALDAVPLKRMRAWGIALSRLQVESDLAWTTFPLAEKEALGIADHDDLDLGNLLARLAEAKITATFLEMRDGTVKISMRARPGYDVAAIAKALGGGGHKQAAGCSAPQPLEAALDLILPQLRELAYR